MGAERPCGVSCGSYGSTRWLSGRRHSTSAPPTNACGLEGRYQRNRIYTRSGFPAPRHKFGHRRRDISLADNGWWRYARAHRRSRFPPLILARGCLDATRSSPRHAVRPARSLGSGRCLRAGGAEPSPGSAHRTPLVRPFSQQTSGTGLFHMLRPVPRVLKERARVRRKRATKRRRRSDLRRPGKEAGKGLQEGQRTLLTRPGQTYVASTMAKLMSRRIPA
jgi:hypothetical protein